MSGGLAAIAPRALLVAVLPLFLVLQALWQPVGIVDGRTLDWSGAPLPFAIAAVLACLIGLWPTRSRTAVASYVAFAGLAAVAPLMLLAQYAAGGTGVAADAVAPVWDAGLWLYLCGLALLAGSSVRRVAALDLKGTSAGWSAALVFGVWLLVFWQLLVEAFDVPHALLPSPLQLWHALLADRSTLDASVVQKALHAVLVTYGASCQPARPGRR